jgi:hypothetical protein
MANEDINNPPKNNTPVGVGIVVGLFRLPYLQIAVGSVASSEKNSGFPTGTRETLTFEILNHFDELVEEIFVVPGPR